MAQPDLGTRTRQDLEYRFAATLMNQALIHEQLDDTFGQLAHYERAIHLLRPLAKARGESQPALRLKLANGLASAYTNNGTALARQGKLSEAIAMYDRAIEIREALAATHPELADDDVI